MAPIKISSSYWCIEYKQVCKKPQEGNDWKGSLGPESDFGFVSELSVP